MRTRIKICGITTPGDAAAAVAAGADCLGVLLAPSKRQISIDEAARVLADVPPLVARVGVFVNADAAFVAEAVERIGLTAVQFHGDETPEQCAAVAVPVIKAFRVGTDFALQTFEPFRATVASLLLDTYTPDSHGGTGRVFDWSAQAGVIPGGASLILAGGLTPQNVAQAICALHPFAVDVSSGVESAPGVKDHTAINAFVAAVRAADQEG
ncbi:MAG: phosphoribosylanthranilate isomerase [Coriobacteriia bacterium]